MIPHPGDRFTIPERFRKGGEKTMVIERILGAVSDKEGPKIFVVEVNGERWGLQDRALFGEEGFVGLPLP